MTPPSEPEAASLQYRPEPALLELGLRALPLLERASISSSGTSRLSCLLSTSISMVSPVMDDGDRAALCRLGGDMADEAALFVPEKRPSVMSAVVLARPRPYRLLHGLEHLAHAGAALRPS